MSAVLDLHPEPGHPAVVVAGVHEVLDTLAPTGETGGYGEAVVECERAIRRLEALKLTLLAAADTARISARTGHASTSAWLAAQTRTGGAKAAREVRLATDLEAGLTATSTALAAGSVSIDHAAVIADATRRLPSGLSPSEVVQVETRLVEKAQSLDPVQLRRVARRALEAVEADTARVDAHEDALLMDEEHAALTRARLTLHDHGDGTTSGRFTIPTLAASILMKVLDAMASPRRGHLGATTAQAGEPGQARDWAHERGLAFTAVLERLPVDRLSGKVAATILVKLDLDTLRGQLRAAGLDTADLVSAAEARRLACGAGIVPAVLDGMSQPLDLGRKKRFFSEAQRVAAAVHHTSCAADGCDVPYAWTEAHHRQPWSRDGESDLADLEPLCGFHHRRIHDPGYLHRRHPDGSIRFTRRT